MNGLHVYTDGTVWVVAHSPWEASCIALGDDWGEGFDRKKDLVLVPDEERFTMTIDDPTDDDDGGEETKTCREWADSFDEPGILASTEDHL